MRSSSAAFVVVEPKSCESCENLFCKDCIGCWTNSSKQCPICREKSEYRNINRLLKKQLTAIQFRCQAQCKQRQCFTYDEVLQHYRSGTCPGSASLSRCPFFCDLNLQLKTKDIETHILVCPNVLVQCQHCQEVLKRSAEEKHVCSYVVKQKRLRVQDSDMPVKTQKKLIRIVAKSLRKSKAIFSEVENDLLTSVEHQFEGDWGCFLGKDLTYITTRGKFCNIEYGKSKSIIFIKMK